MHNVRTQRLATGEWFTSRVSSAGLFSTAYPRATPPLKLELRHLFASLCKDETPMVRRAAAHKLGGFTRVVEREHVARELMQLFTDLIQDGACRCPGLMVNATKSLGFEGAAAHQGEQAPFL